MLNPGGRLVLIAFQGGATAEIALQKIIYRDLREAGVRWHRSLLVAWALGGFFMPIGLAFALWPRIREGVLDLEKRRRG